LKKSKIRVFALVCFVIFSTLLIIIINRNQNPPKEKISSIPNYPKVELINNQTIDKPVDKSIVLEFNQNTTQQQKDEYIKSIQEIKP